ncbi:NAD-dependent epimerase/dehydratase family protein [Solimonas variicoloris]|uniref:NAD-dependent epimerase/dehydratase family protein n=1 Tax=Solimonas variicoloris TaxID=254408 RepID=UPI0003704632|nr:NAD(P)-dependent oxidoreductase [Solimonas variicoloris]
MSARILVLGGSGYIGQQVARALAAGGGAQVIVASRRPRAVPGQRALALDARNADALAGVIGGVDAVVNCVTGAPADIRANADALAATLRRQARAPRLVHLSSMAVYGASTGRVDEGSPLAPQSGYGCAKRDAEEALRRCANTVLLRPGCVYGPGSLQWSVRIAQLLRERRLGDLGAAGDGCCNLVHVDDVVAAVRQALYRDGVAGRTFNLSLADAELPTWNEYFVEFARRLGAVPVARIAARRLPFETQLLAPLLKLAELGLRQLGVDASGLPPAITPSMRTLWQQRIRLDSRRAAAELVLRWKPLDEGLAETAASLRVAPLTRQPA